MIEQPEDPRARLARARAALGGFGPTDFLAIGLLVLAVVFGFIGGFLFSPGAGFLIASGMLFVIGVLAGLS